MNLPPNTRRLPGRLFSLTMTCPVDGSLMDYSEENRKTRPLITAAPDTCKGQTVALCGAGPSLDPKEVLASGCDHVMAVNSAAPWLYEQGVPVTAAIAIDQTEQLLVEWQQAYPMVYYVASTVDPAVVKHLQKHDRMVVFFHNAVGMATPGYQNEFAYYCQRWPPTLMVGYGSTVLTRVVGLMKWFGFEHVHVFGGDHAVTEDLVAHANGETTREAYGNPILVHGEINGRRWVTRPDMLMAAVHLAKLAKHNPDTITLHGDTLPGAIIGFTDDEMDAVCSQLAPGEELPELTGII